MYLGRFELGKKAVVPFVQGDRKGRSCNECSK